MTKDQEIKRKEIGAITGACVPGVKGFVEQNGKRESYTISEMIEVTRGNYGADTFKAFFHG